MSGKCQIFVDLLMVVKSKEYFEKTKNIKKFVLRGQRNTRYHEKKLSIFSKNIIDTGAVNFNVY